MIMGIQIILTESQLANLQKNVGTGELDEMKVGLACTDLSYFGLVDFLNGRQEKKLGHNTIVHMVRVMDSPEDQVAVKYHGTDIIRVDREGVVTLSTGGWDTPTTKDRLNQFLRCRNMSIYQKKGEWYITNRFGHFPYKDGMKVLPDGQIMDIDNVDPRKIPVYKKNMEKLNIDPKFRELYGLSSSDENED